MADWRTCRNSTDPHLYGRPKRLRRVVEDLGERGEGAFERRAIGGRAEADADGVGRVVPRDGEFAAGLDNDAALARLAREVLRRPTRAAGLHPQVLTLEGAGRDAPEDLPRDVCCRARISSRFHATTRSTVPFCIHSAAAADSIGVTITVVAKTAPVTRSIQLDGIRKSATRSPGTTLFEKLRM